MNQTPSNSIIGQGNIGHGTFILKNAHEGTVTARAISRLGPNLHLKVHIHEVLVKDGHNAHNPATREEPQAVSQPTLDAGELGIISLESPRTKVCHANDSSRELGMNMNNHTESHYVAIASTVAATGGGVPTIVSKLVTDAAVLNRGQVFSEALRQTQPIIDPGSSNVTRIAQTVKIGTARGTGISLDVAEKYVTSSRSVEDLFLSGANQIGKTAEAVVVNDYLLLHEGIDTGMVNPPSCVATNVADIRISPDPASCKDLFFAFETKNGNFIFKPNGQVKVGGPQYVSDSLCKMAKTPGYGKIGYVDSKYVNTDGTPKVGPGAFTKTQAERLQAAGVKLRGIKDLHQRAQSLLDDLKASKVDALDPVARKQLETLRDDISRAYSARRVAGRVVTGLGVGAASAAAMSLLVQLVSSGEVELKTVGEAAAQGAVFGAAQATVDAALYHAATEILEMAPEAAKAFAQQGVAVGFCVVAVGTDLFAEISAATRGEITTTGAISGVATKTALDLLPLVMAPLGLVGLPILIGTQIGGRWLISKSREMDARIKAAIDEDMASVQGLDMRMSEFSEITSEIRANCAATDEVFRLAMNASSFPVANSHLQLVHS